VKRDRVHGTRVELHGQLDAPHHLVGLRDPIRLDGPAESLAHALGELRAQRRADEPARISQITRINDCM
jgi:hypothetical protein